MLQDTTKSAWKQRLNLFRKPISSRWHLGIGVAAVVTFLVVYTAASEYLHSQDPHYYLLPTWSQLWTLGVVPALQPEEKGRVDPPEADLQATNAEGLRLLNYLKEPEEVRLRAEDERLKNLASSTNSANLKAEVLRMRAIRTRLLHDEKNQLLADQQKALEALPPELRTQAEKGLKTVDEETQRELDKLVIYQIGLWEDIKATFYRLLLGLSVSILVSLTLGVLMGCYAPIEAYFYPPMAVLAKIPGTVMLSLFMVLAGLNWKFYQAMILFGLIPTLTQTFYVYVKEVPEELIYKARTLGASQIECIFSVIVPNIMPKVVETIRLSIGPALIFLYAAELTFGSDAGLGCTLRLVQKKGLIATPTAYFYLVCIAFFGFAIDYSIRWAQRRFFPWYYAQ